MSVFVEVKQAVPGALQPSGDRLWAALLKCGHERTLLGQRRPRHRGRKAVAVCPECTRRGQGAA
jgi:hypothetical protein